MIDLGENYEYAVAGHPSRTYLWIFSRTPEIDDSLFNRLLDKLKKQDYNASKLMRLSKAREERRSDTPSERLAVNDFDHTHN
ncbi:hypothetical protein D4S03_03935 [bacterium]|nr:MAG: hypothetical protein D4S03_03935 [bacterium]